MSLAHFLFIVSVVHVPLLRVDLRLTRIILIQTARFLVVLGILLRLLRLDFFMPRDQVHLCHLQQKIEMVAAELVHLI